MQETPVTRHTAATRKYRQTNVVGEMIWLFWKTAPLNPAFFAMSKPGAVQYDPSF
jgi:hypothetical protein